ncbi:MAG: MarR family transcriptional regulator [Clostridiales bacterium]|nr:MarR family transcriptional regulator [Clostridiales bacterium]
MDSKDTIIKALKDSKEPLRPGEISEVTGLEKAEVDKAIKVLKKEGKIISPKRCYYSVEE